MKCDLCDKQATIHLTQVVEGKVQKVHLCEACAEETGVDVETPISVTDVLLGLGKESMEPKIEGATRCPSCLMTRSDFKKTARLGCASCYETFYEELSPLIRAMHHSLEHRGKIPARQGKRLTLVREVADLKSALDKAVAEERFEEAAALRDRLEAVSTLGMDQKEAGE